MWTTGSSSSRLCRTIYDMKTMKSFSFTMSWAHYSLLRPVMDTGRVDPRVGSGRVEISEMYYFFLFVSRLK